MKAFVQFMAVSLVLSLCAATGASLNAKPDAPKTTEEYPAPNNAHNLMELNSRVLQIAFFDCEHSTKWQ